jgi:hypothetical protein
MAQNPELPATPGYTARYTGASPVPQIDPYVQTGPSGLERQFAGFSRSLKQGLSQGNAKAIEERLAVGNAWRLKSQKTYTQAVRDGDIDPTQDPWFHVGAMERDGIMGARRLERDIADSWDKVVLDESNPDGRNPDAFDKLYNDKINAYATEHGVDSHYWTNKFFEDTNKWFHAKAPQYRQLARTREFNYETTRAIDLIGNMQQDFVDENGMHGEGNLAIAAAQEHIESLHASGMWNTETRRLLAERLYGQAQDSQSTRIAMDFIGMLRTGPGGQSKFIDEPEVGSVYAKRDPNIRIQEQRNFVEKNKDIRATIKGRIGRMRDATYWRPILEKDPGALRSEIKMITSMAKEFFPGSDLEDLMTNIISSDHYTTENFDAYEESFGRSEELSILSNRAYVLGFEEHWIKMATDELGAGATPVQITKRSKELLAKEESFLKEYGESRELFRTGQNWASFREEVMNNTFRAGLELDSYADESINILHAKNLFEQIGNTYVARSVSPTLADQGPHPALGEDLTAMWMDKEFSAQMSDAGYTKSDHLFYVRTQHKGEIFGLWGDPEAMNAIYANAGMHEKILSADDMKDDHKVMEQWLGVARRSVEYFGEENPLLTHQLEMELHALGNNLLRADNQTDAEFWDMERHRRAFGILELGYQLSDGPETRMQDNSGWAIPKGNKLLDQYIEKRRGSMKPDEAYQSLKLQGGEPVTWMPTDKDTREAMNDWSTSTLGFAMDLPVMSPRSQYASSLIESQLGAEVRRQKDNNMSPRFAQEKAQAKMSSKILVSGNGNFFSTIPIPSTDDGYKGLREIKADGNLDDLWAHVLNEEFYWDQEAYDNSEQVQNIMGSGPAQIGIALVQGKRFNELILRNTNKRDITVIPADEAWSSFIIKNSKDPAQRYAPISREDFMRHYETFRRPPKYPRIHDISHFMRYERTRMPLGVTGGAFAVAEYINTRLFPGVSESVQNTAKTVLEKTTKEAGLAWESLQGQ